MRGPVIKPENIPALINRLSRFPGAKLPTPKTIVSVTRPAVPPTSILEIRKIALGPSWGRTHQFIGELFFEYGDSPRMPPLTSSAPRQHIGQVDGKRVVWPRDLKAERTAAAELLGSSLVPFGK